MNDHSLNMRSVLPALLLLVGPALLSSTVAIVRAAEESVVDGVVHVSNGTDPAEGVQTVHMEELWRVGGADDEETIFGVINRILTDDRNIYLLDFQLAQVRVFSHAGEPAGILGHEGEGPGEFRQPVDMGFLPDGTLGVLQALPGKVIKLNLDGSPAGTWTLGDPARSGSFVMRGLSQGGGVVVAGGVQQSIDEATGTVTLETFLSRLNDAGLRDRTYAAKTVTLQMQNLHLDEVELTDGPHRRFDVAADGRVVVAIPRNRYEVSIFTRDGSLERVFGRDYVSWRRNERALDIWRRILESHAQAQAPGAPISYEKTEPDVEQLRVGPDGSIWILTSRAMWVPPAGVFTSYDVFTPAGRFQKQVNVVCPGNPRQDLLFWTGEDLAFLVTGYWDSALARFGGTGATIADEDEPEPMAVICYRVVP
jgi:hypothetical protein